MPGKASFQENWLEMPEFKSWLSADRENKYRAYCNVCRKYFNVTRSGLSNVRQHAQGKTHKLLVIPVESGTQTTLAFTSKNSLSTSNQNQNPVTVDENQNFPSVCTNEKNQNNYLGT